MDERTPEEQLEAARAEATEYKNKYQEYLAIAGKSQDRVLALEEEMEELKKEQSGPSTHVAADVSTLFRTHFQRTA